MRPAVRLRQAGAMAGSLMTTALEGARLGARARQVTYALGYGLVAFLARRLAWPGA